MLYVALSTRSSKRIVQHYSPSRSKIQRPTNTSRLAASRQSDRVPFFPRRATVPLAFFAGLIIAKQSDFFSNWPKYFSGEGTQDPGSIQSRIASVLILLFFVGTVTLSIFPRLITEKKIESAD